MLAITTLGMTMWGKGKRERRDSSQNDKWEKEGRVAAGGDSAALQRRAGRRYRRFWEWAIIDCRWASFEPVTKEATLRAGWRFQEHVWAVVSDRDGHQDYDRKDNLDKDIGPRRKDF